MSNRLAGWALEAKVIPIDDRPVKENVPSKRYSQPAAGGSSYSIGNKNINGKFVLPELLPKLIPIIRKLSMFNGDVSQVLHNICTLGNTGHKIYFDRKVSPEKVDAMRNHLQNKRKEWATGQAGMDGVVNKMIYQLMIGGAVSTEWVPNTNLTGIEGLVFVNPEDIVFKRDARNIKYIPFQKVSFGAGKTGPQGDLVKLNPNTYKYFALNGDTDLPYGIPPYISAIPRIESQGKMNDNIDYVVDQLGIIGFLEVLLEKPQQGDMGEGNESDVAYEQRLASLLDEARARLKDGLRTGIVTGFNGDHTFKFNTFGKDYERVVDLYKNNELQLATSLKQDASLWGRDYNTSESQITVVFMKMLSELRNMQNIVKSNLEFGYALELILAGFTFDALEVKFNRSTIQDDLKYQQSEEIKIRNVRDKFILGIIDQDQAADELGYDTPAESAPLVEPDVLAGKGGSSGEEAQDGKTEKKKDASDKKVRAKNKPQGAKK